MHRTRRMTTNKALVAVGILCMAHASVAASPKWIDSSPHKIKLVAVSPDLRIETLDWGGSGRPIVLLAGLGNTAHIFDEVAITLRERYHVYAVTRRGFGKSDMPADGYDTDRLADDVLGALDALRLKRVVLVGHSIAGLEMSSLAARFPDRVAGLIYLDTTYVFDQDDKDLFGVASWHEHLQALRNRLDVLSTAQYESLPELRQLVDTDMPALRQDLEMLLAAQDARRPFVPPGASDLASFTAFRGWFGRIQGFVPPEAELRESFNADSLGAISGQQSPQWVSDKILAGQKKYAGIKIPTLGLFAVDSRTNPNLPDNERSRTAQSSLKTIAQARAQRRANAFSHDMPGAKIVFIESAPHHMFLSHPEEVVRQITLFAEGLKAE